MKTTFLASIRGKILLAFFVIVGVSFAVAATSLSGLVSEFLLDQRTREDALLTEKVVDAVEPLYRSLSMEELNRTLAENAETMDGRLLLLDRTGKVQADSFQALCGQRLELNEVLLVLLDGQSEAYGTYSPGWEEAEAMSGERGARSVAYSVRALTGPDRSRGALIFVSRIQGLVDALSGMRWQLVTVFAVIAAAALALALFLSRVLTKPITSLSKTMSKMGKGDLSVRVPVQGSGELRELAENYNTMAEQLESLDKTRSQFVSNASHELKTPLTTMKVMLETMIYQPDMPEELRQEFMGDMNHEIDRLTGIITDLLTLTRMDQGVETVRREPVDLSGLTEETLRLLRPAAEKRNQRLEGHVAPGVRVLGDRIKLNQILYNLTENAMKYTQDGGLIRVTLEEEKGEAVWRVKDNGVGIPGEDLSHIFERFYRVDKARSRDTGGTGLGLSIVKQLVKLEGGTIAVESEPGKGSEFTVRFPEEAEP